MDVLWTSGQERKKSKVSKEGAGPERLELLWIPSLCAQKASLRSSVLTVCFLALSPKSDPIQPGYQSGPVCQRPCYTLTNADIRNR